MVWTTAFTLLFEHSIPNVLGFSLVCKSYDRNWNAPLLSYQIIFKYHWKKTRLVYESKVQSASAFYIMWVISFWNQILLWCIFPACFSKQLVTDRTTATHIYGQKTATCPQLLIYDWLLSSSDLFSVYIESYVLSCLFVLSYKGLDFFKRGNYNVIVCFFASSD